jgi:hypothetical protein
VGAVTALEFQPELYGLAADIRHRCNCALAWRLERFKSAEFSA